VRRESGRGRAFSLGTGCEEELKGGNHDNHGGEQAKPTSIKNGSKSGDFLLMGFIESKEGSQKERIRNQGEFKGERGITSKENQAEKTVLPLRGQGLRATHCVCLYERVLSETQKSWGTKKE